MKKIILFYNTRTGEYTPVILEEYEDYKSKRLSFSKVGLIASLIFTILCSTALFIIGKLYDIDFSTIQYITITLLAFLLILQSIRLSTTLQKRSEVKIKEISER